MTLQRAKELLLIQVDLGSGYNRNAARIILAEVQRTHGQLAVDQLIQELTLNKVFGFKKGGHFSF